AQATPACVDHDATGARREGDRHGRMAVHSRVRRPAWARGVHSGCAFQVASRWAMPTRHALACGAGGAHLAWPCSTLATRVGCVAGALSMRASLRICAAIVVAAMSFSAFAAGPVLGARPLQPVVV